MAYNRSIHRFACIAMFLVAAAYGVQIGTANAGVDSTETAAHSGLAPAVEESSPVAGHVPGESLGNVSDSEIWRAVRRGLRGQVSIPDKQAGVLIQSEGENFRIVQNGPLPVWGGWLMLGMIVLLAAFYLLRGRIRITGGFSGHNVRRFTFVERFMHWLVAVSFIILALTGLNILYGRYVLKPVMGASAFAAMTQWGKYFHDYVAFAFMAGLLLMFALWVRYNFPTLVDLKWLAKGGGMFTRGGHPPAYKFNAGQKMLFWILAVGGFSVSVSGVCLLMPFTFHPFAATLSAINLFGFHLPTALTALQETQLSLIWHAAVTLVLIVLMFFHVYIGSLGMEGAFSSMVGGQVDENWAREHHSLWLKEIKSKAGEAAPGAPLAK